MDRDLVVRVQKGDQRAFEALTLADHPRMFRVAYGILRERGLAEDATQRALLDIWQDIRRLRDPGSYEGWSYRLLVRACYVEAKRKPQWLPDTDILPADMPRAVDAFGQIEDRDQLERGFRRLSVEHRTVIVLRCLLDLPMEQVAEVLGIAPGTVGSRLSRALDALRAALEADARPATPARLHQQVVP